MNLHNPHDIYFTFDKSNCTNSKLSTHCTCIYNFIYILTSDYTVTHVLREFSIFSGKS